MASVIETLRQSDFTEATLWTSEDNHRPRRIYETAGWTLDGTDARQTVARGELPRAAVPNPAVAG